jgi:hypothetical protein
MPSSIDRSLEKALASSWSEADWLAAIQAVQDALPGAKSDVELPERWGAVHLGREAVAVLWLNAPLATVVGATPASFAARDVLHARGVDILNVDTMRDEAFAVSWDIICRFAGCDVTDQIDWSCFCAVDLLYATR